MIYVQFYEKHRDGAMWPVCPPVSLSGKHDRLGQVQNLVEANKDEDIYYEGECVTHALIFSTSSDEYLPTFFALSTQVEITVCLTPETPV